jgi:uncharacterized protein YbjT (DUF2867 family)
VQTVTAILRRTLPLQSEKLKQIIIPDFSDLPQYQASLIGEIFISCLGTTMKQAGSKENFEKIDYQAVLDLGRIAVENSAQTFMLVTAQGANLHSPFFYNQVKGRIEAALTELRFKRLVIFRPSLLIGERRHKRAAEQLAISTYRLLSPLLPSKLTALAGTEVSKLVLRMLQEMKSQSAGIKVIGARDLSHH